VLFWWEIVLCGVCVLVILGAFALIPDVYGPGLEDNPVFIITRGW
jgi:hypothetical protein